MRARVGKAPGTCYTHAIVILSVAFNDAFQVTSEEGGKMRQFLLVLIAGLALVLGGCTTSTDGGGNDIDTQAFYPNDEDNYWTYEVTGDINQTQTWTIIGDPDYILTRSLQRMRIHVEGDPDNTYIDFIMQDDEEESVVFKGVDIYEDGVEQTLETWSDFWTLLFWNSDGLDVGDDWDAWSISGIEYPELMGVPSSSDYDSYGFELSAEVTDTVDFDYDGTTLTAYLIEVSGDVFFEEDGVDPDEWDSCPWQRDFYFVPEFGFVAIQEYTVTYQHLVESNYYTLTDTNVLVPE